MAENLIQLEADKYYHIYNHAISNENFFENENDYKWFLEKIKKYIVPVSDILSYCLMPNHFHLVVRMKSDADIFKTFAAGSIRQKEMPQDFISQQYGNLFNAYAKYFNYTHHRKGTLFTRAFRRKHVDDREYLKQLICYVHQNPVEAGFCNKISDWKYSSYNAITGLNQTLICKKEVIEMFDTVENFIYCNAVKVELEVSCKLKIMINAVHTPFHLDGGGC